MLFIVFLVFSGTLLLLPTGFIGPVFLFGGMLFFGFIGIHYFVWGRWLSKVLAEQHTDDPADRS